MVEMLAHRFKSSVEFLDEVRSRLADLGAGRRKATMDAVETALNAFIKKIKGMPSATVKAVRQDQISVLNLRKSLWRVCRLLLPIW